MWAQFSVVLLKDALGRAKWELTVGILSSGPYLDVETLSKVIIL